MLYYWFCYLLFQFGDLLMIQLCLVFVSLDYVILCWMLVFVVQCIRLFWYFFYVGVCIGLIVLLCSVLCVLGIMRLRLMLIMWLKLWQVLYVLYVELNENSVVCGFVQCRLLLGLWSLVEKCQINGLVVVFFVFVVSMYMFMWLLLCFSDVLIVLIICILLVCCM